MTTDKNPQKIEEMFDNISDSYNRNNNIISLGFHNLVKKRALKLLEIKNNSKILDLFCGTGDIVSLFLKTHKNLKIIGVDFSENMLKIAKNRSPQSEFIKADCTNLPFEENCFDIITMSFGLRNVQNRKRAIIESYRILKPEGELLHLDFGLKNIFSKVFDIIAFCGIKLFYNRKLPYKYLIDSKNEFPEPQKLIEEFETAGFKLKQRKDFLFGIISAQVFVK